MSTEAIENTSAVSAATVAANEHKLTKARTAIVVDHPFFASLLLRRPCTWSDRVPTAGVNALGEIMLNHKFVEPLTMQQTVFLLCHEIGHVIMQHFTRVGSRDKMKWNIAGDVVINDMLKAASVGEIIPGGVEMEGAREMSTDAVYNKLPDMPKQKQQGGGIGEDMDFDENMSESEREQLEAEMKVEIAQAAQAAKMRGKLHAALGEFVGKLLEVKTPWFDILERYMVSFTRGEYSWARPNRRFIGAGNYLPSTGRVSQMGTIVLQIDVSGSVSETEMRHYGGHFKRIVEQCHPEKVHVIYTDTEVSKHVEFENPEDVELTFMRGGGTHMPAGFDWVAKEGIEPEVFITLSDGYTDFGQDPGYPVIWCISSKVQAPWGINVHFELNEE